MQAVKRIGSLNVVLDLILQIRVYRLKRMSIVTAVLEYNVICVIDRTKRTDVIQSANIL